MMYGIKHSNNLHIWIEKTGVFFENKHTTDIFATSITSNSK
jgi:hypothetical protein